MLLCPFQSSAGLPTHPSTQTPQIHRNIQRQQTQHLTLQWKLQKEEDKIKKEIREEEEDSTLPLQPHSQNLRVKVVRHAEGFEDSQLQLQQQQIQHQPQQSETGQQNTR